MPGCSAFSGTPRRCMPIAGRRNAGCSAPSFERRSVGREEVALAHSIERVAKLAEALRRGTQNGLEAVPIGEEVVGRHAEAAPAERFVVGHTGPAGPDRKSVV